MPNKVYLQPDTQGIVPIYKPKGPSSHWVVNRIRLVTNCRRVGHAGTLDPLADGVLVVGITRQATKLLAKFVTKEKEYLAKIYLGSNSSTDDAAGQKFAVSPSKPDLQAVDRAIKHFIGEIEQIPPDYSATKIKGQRAYKLARTGQIVNLQPKKRNVYDIQILKYRYPEIELRVITGAGVYIRSLARDIGAKLGTGAYLSQLTRTRVGQLKLDQCYYLPEEFIYRPKSI